MRYLELAESLRGEIVAGARRPGGVIDSESTLASRHCVSRDTVRRALEHLRSEGLLASRQGFGWYIALDPVRQALGKLTTIEATLAEAGLHPARRVIEFAVVTAPGSVARDLALPNGKDVLRVRRINLANGEPFAIVTVWAPLALTRGLARDDLERSTFYELFDSRGVCLGSARQTITAGLATAEDARLLAVPEASPLLVCRRITHDVDGKPVLCSEHRYPAHRTEFSVEVPRADLSAGFAPPGVRLIKGVQNG